MTTSPSKFPPSEAVVMFSDTLTDELEWQNRVRAWYAGEPDFELDDLFEDWNPQ